MHVRRSLFFCLSALATFAAAVSLARHSGDVAPKTKATPFAQVTPGQSGPRRAGPVGPGGSGGTTNVRGMGGMGGQFYRGDESGGTIVRGEGNILIDEANTHTAREVASHSTGTPEWKNPVGFEKDVFTFARIMFKHGGVPPPGALGWGRGPHLGWWVDFPDADLNFSYRLQQLTSIRTDPDGRVIKLSDPTLTDYPLIMMEHPGYIILNETETVALRNYLLNGGALFVSDFWSRYEWDLFEAAMKRVLPGRTWTDVPMDHPIFHAVFNLKGPLQHLQVPTMQFWNMDHDWNNPSSPPLQDRDRGVGSDTMSVRAWYDDKGRMIALVIHNSDVPDGWEREGEDDRYFRTFSEKISYPLGVNIVFYLMTH